MIGQEIIKGIETIHNIATYEVVEEVNSFIQKIKYDPKKIINNLREELEIYCEEHDICFNCGGNIVDNKCEDCGK